MLKEMVKKDHLLQLLEEECTHAFISLPTYFDHLLQFLEQESTHAVISVPANLPMLDVRVIYH